LWEIEMQAIQTITWSTNGGRSPLGTKMQWLTVAFKHAIRPDGSLLAKLEDVDQDKQMDGKPPIETHAIQPDGSLLADDAVQDKMDGKPPFQAELKHQMGKQTAGWCFKMTPTIENQGKHANWHEDA
jgi:hypothetical protein